MEDTKTEKTRTVKKGKKAGKVILIILSALLAFVLVAIALYQIPAIKKKFYPYVTVYKARLIYALKPPSKSVFEPSVNSTMDLAVVQSLTAMAPIATSTPVPSATPVTETDETKTVAEPSPTAVPTPLPAAVKLEGIVQEYQRFNSCGPANLALAMRYWGWVGEQTDIEAVIKPKLEDLNVFPEELIYFVQTQTNLDALMRYGGDIDLLKKFIAAGYPVMVERGYINRDEKNEDGWMGHYSVVDAYDDARAEVHMPDTFNGYIWRDYDLLQSDWDQFGGTYLIVFPAEDKDKILDLLGEHADAEYNLDYTLNKFRTRLQSAERHEQYFLWTTVGELLVLKKDYAEAAKAFDEAFAVYRWLPLDDRPWRMLWYQIGPFEAYYNMGRYDDVIRLAYKTVTDIASAPGFPEIFLWSARAQIKEGNIGTATFELKRALQYHPNWEPALAELKALGVEP